MTAPLFSEGQLRRLTIEGLKRQLSDKLGGMQRLVGSIADGNTIYRGVRHDTRPSAISELSYPPPEAVKMGRLNRPGQPVFYGSAAPVGPFYELRARKGEHIAFSHWKVTEPLWMHNLGYHKDALSRMGAAAVAPRSYLTEPIRNETRQNNRLRKQVALAFTEDVRSGQEWRYKQSIALSEFWCEHEEALPIEPGGPLLNRVGGFVYPSLQLRGDADNVAIWPDVVHSCLALAQVQYVLVEEADPSKMAYTFLTEAVSATFEGGSRIVWHGDLPDEAVRRCHISYQNGTWAMRDGRGRVYGVQPD